MTGAERIHRVLTDPVLVYIRLGKELFHFLRRIEGVLDLFVRAGSRPVSEYVYLDLVDRL